MKKALPIVGIILVLVGGGVFFASRGKNDGKGTTKVTPTPLPPAVQLPVEQQPKVSLTFSKDAHYVTVNITNLHSDQLEYNLIYDAVVKKQQIQTGVNASAKLEGKTTYSKEQLLGSESSGKFSYHEQIKNAVMELTLRDASNRSIFTATYPFTVSAGKTIDLSPSL